jgi:hypothetical protein
MADKIIDFKKATDSNLIKLWVEHYKEQGEKKLLTKQETQELYNEGYTRGLGNKLVFLYNSLYALQMTTRQEINYEILRLYTLSDNYIVGFNKLEEIAYIYELKAKSKDVIDYRERVIELLIRGVKMKLEIGDKKAGEGDILEIGIVNLKKHILFCKKVQDLVDIDIMSDSSKQQINSAREMILLVTSEIINGIDYLKYKLGLGKTKTIKRDEDFYKLIDKHIGVDMLAKKMEVLEKIIGKHRNSKEFNEYLKKVIKDHKDIDDAREKMNNYPIENYGLSEADIKDVEDDIQRLKSLRTL